MGSNLVAITYVHIGQLDNFNEVIAVSCGVYTLSYVHTSTQ